MVSINVQHLNLHQSLEFWQSLITGHPKRVHNRSYASGGYSLQIPLINLLMVNLTPPFSVLRWLTGCTGLGLPRVNAIDESIDDASITALVKTILLYHRSTSALHTTVHTSDGLVYLGGKAQNAAEEDLATKYISKVHGVKRVVNNMTIEDTHPEIN